MRRVLMIVLGLPLFSFPALAADIEVETSLRAATVYTDRAALTRSVKVDIPAGKHTVVFKNLSRKIHADSLRVEGEGNAPVTLGALSYKIVNEVSLVNEKERALKDQLEKLSQQEEVLREGQRVLDTQRKFYESLMAQSANSVKEEISVYEFNTEKWIEASKTLYSGLFEVAKGRFELEQQIKEIGKQKAKIQKDLNQIRTGNKSFYEVRLPVEADRAGALTLSLSYQISGAHWRPVYDARLDTSSGAVSLSQYGSVNQRTGEDWSDIELTLSTARPHRGANVPNLGPMWVDVFKPQPRSRAMGNSFGNVTANIAGASVASAPMADMEAEPLRSVRLEEMAPQKAKVQSAQINTSGFTAEYVIPGPSSVLSDGTESKVFVGTFDLESEMQIHIKPQLDTNAYLVANLTLGGENTVLPGQVNLFRDNAFIGRSHAGFLRPGQEIDLSFGVDDQVEVKRKVLKDEKAESGMFVGKTEVLERRYVTEINNLRDKELTVRVDEAVPAPKNEKVMIKLLDEATSEGYTKDADKVKGLLRWEFPLVAKGEKDLELGWRISWPQGENLTGLR